MATLIDTGARAKLRNLFNALEERIPEEALRPMAMEVAKQVAARAPSPDQEFQTMMYGGSLMGDSKTSDRGGEENDTRIRFIKPYENYLRNYLSASFGVHGLFVGIGNIEELNRISSYAYQNKGGQRYTVDQPFWYAWEFGGVFTITPKFQPKHGRGYPLKPTPDLSIWRMTKVIPARNMFTSINQLDVIDNILIPNIKKIIRSI
jgi:hypothetical protein